MKTKKEWDDSKKCLNEFLEVGDVVDEGIYYYFLEVLPPAYVSANCIQIGEPYAYSTEGPNFPTLVKKDGQWIYAGNIATKIDSI